MLRIFIAPLLLLLTICSFSLATAAETDRKLRYKVFNIAECRPSDWDEFRIRDYKKVFDHDFQSGNILDYDYVFIILNSWSDGEKLKPVAGYPLPQIIQFISKGNNENSTVSGVLNFANDIKQRYFAMSNASVSDFCFAKYVLDSLYGMTKMVKSDGGNRVDLSLYGVC